MTINFLIVDDEEAMVELLKRYLAPIASRIDEAHELREALQMAETGIYNIIILDLRLVKTGKEEAFAAIPHFKRNRASVVVVTGIPDPAIKEQSLLAGADSFVPKDGGAIQNALLMATHIATLKLPHDCYKPPDYLDRVKLLEQMVHVQ